MKSIEVQTLSAYIRYAQSADSHHPWDIVVQSLDLGVAQISKYSTAEPRIVLGTE